MFDFSQNPPAETPRHPLILLPEAAHAVCTTLVRSVHIYPAHVRKGKVQGINGKQAMHRVTFTQQVQLSSTKAFTAALLMKLQATLAVLGLLLVGSWAKLPPLPNVTLPSCHSPEAHEGAQAALDFINSQHTHGYKYALNQIEDIKIYPRPDGTEVYKMELEFLETKCHVLDPTSAALCPVRTKQETAVEADCDVALSKAAGVLSVVAFKCKTETETPDFPCAGCPYLIPFNDTDAAQLIKASLDDYNRNNTSNAVFELLEVGRLSSQIVGGGSKIRAEFAIIETNCTAIDDGVCVPLHHTVARHGFCLSEGLDLGLTVNCHIFSPLSQVVDPNVNASVPSAQPPVLLHAHTSGPGYSPTIHALKHHKLTPLHDPTASGLVSAESAESLEASVVVPAAPIVKRDVAPIVVGTQPADAPVAGPIALVRCPGRVIHF
ncbi:alpha-2-HS-glycoprotein 2 [Colossoma macropomum]|uniref:alpha-2-HS-glycoprotein 2 n=1 Tax=Colossoma macropomum TaxID=42526 RepID=UPI001864EBAF|nr:alpha-2-HS-glycoprotein 2 [Colossoma macropomum]